MGEIALTLARHDLTVINEGIMYPIKLSNSMARGLLNMAAKNDVRANFVGVFVDMKERVLVATDGCVMGICRPEYIDNIGDSFIIPRAALEAAVKLKGTIWVHESDGKYWLQVNDAVIGFVPLNMKFINWEAAIPRETSGQLGQYNPQLLARSHDFLNMCTNQKMTVPYLHQNGTGAAIMTIPGKDAIALVMPWRSDTPESDFLDSLIAPKQAAA